MFKANFRIETWVEKSVYNDGLTSEKKVNAAAAAADSTSSNDTV